MILLLTLLLIYLSSRCFCAELDGALDHDVNPSLRDQLYDADLAASTLFHITHAARIPPNFLTPILGYSDDIADRARMHVASPDARFALFAEPGNDQGAIAYTTYSFQHERTGEVKQAVLMLSLMPQMRGELVGEAHFPKGKGEQWGEAWRRLNMRAVWDRRALVRRFGWYTLRF